jgi:DNA-binding transcriptional ArsR family regulator
MHAFDVLGDPVRRRIIELLYAGGDQVSAGDLTAAVVAEFGITQPAVSRHLKVLRDNGFASVAIDGNRRLYTVRSEPMAEVDAWLARYRRFWPQRLDALGTEIARGRKRSGRTTSVPEPGESR